MVIVSLSDESDESYDTKYSLKFVVITDVICFLVGFGFHYFIEHV